MARQIIKVIVQLVNRFTKNAKKIETNMNGMSKKARLLTTYSERLGRSTADLERGLGMQGLAISKTGRLYEKLTGRSANVAKSMQKAKNMTNQFRMELLGTMFFGMMVMQVFQGIAKTGVDAFMKITEGQTQAGQAILRLQGAFQYLQFAVGDAIGSALIPHMDAIIGIVEALVDWIDRNPQLTATLITLGIVLGGSLFLIGSLGLGITSVMQLIGVSGAAVGGKSLIARLGGLNLGLFGVGAALVALQASWEANWGNIQETFSEKNKIIFDTLGTLNNMLIQVFQYNWEDVMWSFKRIGINAFMWVLNQGVQFLNQMIGMMNFVGSFAGFEIPSIGGVGAFRENMLKALGPRPSSLTAAATTTSGTDNGNTTETGDVVTDGAVKVETINFNITASSDLGTGVEEYGGVVAAAFERALNDAGYNTTGGIT